MIEHYLMQLSLIVCSMTSKKKLSLKDFKLDFGNEKKIDKELATKLSKGHWTHVIEAAKQNPKNAPKSKNK